MEKYVEISEKLITHAKKPQSLRKKTFLKGLYNISKQSLK